MNDPATRRLQHVIAGLRLPVIAAPMFLVSGARLVLAACREGVIGSFPTAYARTTEMLEAWLRTITEELARDAAAGRPCAPWSANLIVHPTNSRAAADLELLVQYRAPIVIASVGNPSRIVARVHDYGGLVFSDIATLAHARKAAQSGVDALILLCGGSGGHTGWMNPFAFVPAVREFFDKPIILAGSITDGAAIRAALELGANLAYVGTRFIATQESDASMEYRNLVVSSTADDIVLSSEVSGLPANWLRGSLEKLGFKGERQEPSRSFSADANFKAWRDIWAAGHGVGSVKRVATVSEVIAELEAEFHRRRAPTLSGSLHGTP
ncbi:MAG TPA: nitronate monooxygenase [Steroidobacteraceae bacterium]|nr:nitronate monooxygenase [Steroidobacteraceae bacterium]